MSFEATSSVIKIGILGGGQLGKMLANSAAQWHLKIFCLDPTNDCPAKIACYEHVKGSYKEYDEVYNFGKQMDIITIETEHVNAEALIQLKKEGKTIHPDPEQLYIIQDKSRQRMFYAEKKLPTIPFQFYPDKSSLLDAIHNGDVKIPFVQKVCKEGYDGKGVIKVSSNNDLKLLVDAPSLAEKVIEIKKEIAVIAARNSKGEIKTYEPVEMFFVEGAYMLDSQICPAEISETQKAKAIALAVDTIQAYGISGLLAVEMFIDENDVLMINEVAPRPHNSGHHTIESAITSQYEQHLRCILNLPLGSTELLSASVLLNLIGEKDQTGESIFSGWEEVMKIEGVHVHNYGKKETKPFRKMGHVTILGNDKEILKDKAKLVKQTLKVTAKK